MNRSALLVIIALFTINAEPAVAASDAECRALLRHDFGLLPEAPTVLVNAGVVEADGKP